MTRFLTACTLLVWMVASCAAAGAAVPDWPEWQGPKRDAVSTEKGLAQEWTGDGPPLLWKIEGLGKGFSTVSIVGNRIYTMGDRKDEQFIIALDLPTHKELWAAKVGGPWGDGTRCTPTVEGGLVWAIGTRGDLVCVKADSGEEVWRKSFPKDFGGKMMSEWGYSESPLVDGDKLVCTPGGKDAGIVALNKKTGETIWQCAIPDIGGRGKDGAAYSSIVVSEGAGVRQYVTLMGRGAVGVAAKDGKFLWGYNKIANGTAIIPTPVVRGDHVFVSSAYGTGAALLKLSKDGDGVKADEVYFLGADTFQNHHGGMILMGDHIYAGHGHNAGQPICIELESGKIAWRAEDVPGGGSAAVLYADGNLYVRYESGVMALIQATPEKYALKGTFKIAVKNGPSWPHPVIHDGKLYLRDHDVLMCYDVSKK